MGVAKGTPHLTPASLVGERFGKDVFGDVRVALVGFCPRPDVLDRYEPRDTHEQYFIHVPPASVQLCAHEGRPFLSLVHVYGGPVASALIEELAFYGVEVVLAYGLAGGLGTKGLRMGDAYLVERAWARDGTTPHYTLDALLSSDEALNAAILRSITGEYLAEVTAVQAITSDAIYREFDDELDDARALGCDIVNCDSSHLFAVSRAVGIRTTQCGIISDVTGGAGKAWNSTLSVMLSAEHDEALSPISRVGNIVRYYVEQLMPTLALF